MLHIPGAYEGEGKTTIHILNKEAELGLMIDGYSQVSPSIIIYRVDLNKHFTDWLSLEQ